MNKSTILMRLSLGICILIIGISILLGLRTQIPIFAATLDEYPVFLPIILKNSELIQDPEYVVIGWNDLGMHCYDQDYSVFSILPPYNTLWAQVVLQGDPPQLMTEDILVEFGFPDNTESASKTNFWDYEDKLFGVELAPNIGLTGVGLSGEMELVAEGAYFIAEGIPLTEFSDSAPDTPDPYQLATLTVKAQDTGVILAETTIVAPVSSEMRCDTCHNQEDPSNFRRDILLIHDEENQTDLTTQADGGNPVLCAECHADPALGLPGEPQNPTLSEAIHESHALETQDCYACHPGNQTQCLRDIMSQPPTSYWCDDCHGDMQAVGSHHRTPWEDEPRCDDCHDPAYAENPGVLYRLSVGHGGMYCESCHNSTHAILPSSESRDNLQSIALQGYADTITECTVCHLTEPTSDGPHIP
jgi:hypothetical protein